MTGTIFNIQKFCVNDGPGIRTTVFMKGCPLRCAWCHNPESQSRKPELMFDAEKCVLCGRCVPLCKNGVHTLADGKHILDRDRCVGCFDCTNTHCNALSGAGKTVTVEEVIAEVWKDHLFYEHSGGGMTVSGGEPFFQHEFLTELLRAAKDKGLHICVETCGQTSFENLRKASEFVDIFLYDIKLTNEEDHIRYTGVSNRQICENLLRLDELGAKTVLRCPIIPNVNDNDAHFEGVAALANRLKHVREINIEPYHPLGKSKSEHLGRDYDSQLADLGFTEAATVETWIAAVQSHTETPVKKA